MKINFRNLGSIAAFLTALYAFAGCNEATILGKDLIPGDEKVTVKDTTINNLITYNIATIDSSIVTGYTQYWGMLGSVTNDNIFGKTHGFLYTQVSLPSAEFTFTGTGQVLDSVVLYIGCDTIWYGENAPIRMKVYRMNEPNFKHDSLYGYSRPLSYDPGNMVADQDVWPVYPKDSLSVYGTKYAPQMRIKLSNAFGNDLLQQRADANFKTDSAFREYFKGLAIVPDTINGRTMLFPNVGSADTRIVVYYKNSENDSLSATFPFTQYASAHANYVTHNYNNAEVAKYINTNRPGGDSLIYLQEAPGIYTNITIPGLENMNKAIINKAELVITEISSGSTGKDDVFTEPDRLSLWRYATHDSVTFLIDYGNPGNPDLAYFGGNRTVISDLGTIKVVQYKFNIARQLQFILDKKMDNSVLKLEAVSGRYPLDLRRLKAGGGNITPPANIKLRIIYTQL